jgi:hypothetical protein
MPFALTYSPAWSAPKTQPKGLAALSTCEFALRRHGATAPCSEKPIAVTFVLRIALPIHSRVSLCPQGQPHLTLATLCRPQRRNRSTLAMDASRRPLGRVILNGKTSLREGQLRISHRFSSLLQTMMTGECKERKRTEESERDECCCQ